MFNISCTVTKARTINGDFVIRGIASDTSIDRDEEMFTAEAVQKMKERVEQTRVPLRAEHQQGWHMVMGYIKSADINKDGQLIIEAVVDKELSLGKDFIQLCKMARKGLAEMPGFSVAGDVLEVGMMWREDLKRHIRAYKDIRLQEISLVSHPSNTNVTLEVPFAKSVNWDNISADGHLTTNKTYMLYSKNDAPEQYQDVFTDGVVGIKVELNDGIENVTTLSEAEWNEITTGKEEESVEKSEEEPVAEEVKEEEPKQEEEAPAEEQKSDEAVEADKPESSTYIEKQELVATLEVILDRFVKQCVEGLTSAMQTVAKQEQEETPDTSVEEVGGEEPAADQAEEVVEKAVTTGEVAKTTGSFEKAFSEHFSKMEAMRTEVFKSLDGFTKRFSELESKVEQYSKAALSRKSVAVAQVVEKSNAMPSFSTESELLEHNMKKTNNDFQKAYVATKEGRVL